MAVMTQLLATLRAQQLAADTESSPFLDALALDIRVITDEDILADNNYGRLQLGADLRLIGTRRRPGCQDARSCARAVNYSWAQRTPSTPARLISPTRLPSSLL